MAIRVCSFESRRAAEMASLIEKQGGEPTVAPSMKEIPLEHNEHLPDLLDQFQAGKYGVVIFMTGVGAQALFDAMTQLNLWEPFQEELEKRIIIVRGPKPVPVLKKFNIHIDHRAPEPNTWREVVDLIDQESIPVAEKGVAIQEYGKSSTELYEVLKERGAEIHAVPIYKWALPDDLEPLQATIRAGVDTPYDLVMFTSAQQVDHVLQVAKQLGCLDEWRDSMSQSAVASIGPTCTERLVEHGIKVAMEPSHPKMGHLVREGIQFVSESLND